MGAFDGILIPAERQAAEWCDRVWGEREGHFHAAFGIGGHFNDADRYQFERWHDRSGRWPDDRDRFLAETLERADTDDVYVAPYLRSNASRKKGSALPSNYLYADLDEVPERLHGFEQLLIGPGGLLVSSGRGLHPYLRLPADLEPAELEHWNRRLARKLGADAGWAENKVLRLPGTFNHKDRARGGESAPVFLLNGARAEKDWTLAELAAFLPEIEEPSLGGDGDPIEPVMPETVPERLLDRLEEEPNDRSKQTFNFVRACLEEGLSEEETLALALQHRPTREKYGDRAEGEITRTILKVRPAGNAPETQAETPPEDETFRLEPVDWQALAAGGIPKLEYLAEPFLPRRKRIWGVGPAESGKSIWAAAKCAELSRAGDLVVYFSQENGLEEEARRFLRLRPDFDRLHLYVDQGLDLLIPEHRDVAFAAVDGAALVVFDTLTACWSGDEDSNADLNDFDRDVLKPLVALGASSLVLDHTGNPQQFARRRGVSAPRGASTKGQKTDFLLEFKANGEGGFRVERGKKRGTHGKEPRDYQVIDTPDDGLELVESVAEERDLVGEIADLMTENDETGWWTASGLKHPKDKGGVGADVNAVKEALEDDRFEKVAGPEIGKRKGSTYYRLKDVS